MLLAWRLSLMIWLCLALLGCSGATTDTPATSPGPDRAAAAETAPPALADDMAAKVDKAVQVARAVKEDPAAVEEILERHGLTAETLEDLLYEIAQDPAASAAYRSALQP